MIPVQIIYCRDICFIIIIAHYWNKVNELRGNTELEFIFEYVIFFAHIDLDQKRSHEYKLYIICVLADVFS